MASPKAGSLRFTQIRLENWRNFSRVEVDLQRRVFLVGPNASGKSNFEDVFRFLCDIVAVGGGFQAAVTRRGGVSSIRCLAARRYPDIAVRVSIGDDDQPSAWEYELCFNQDKQRRPIIRRERVLREGKCLLDRPDSQDEADPARLSQTYLEQVYANQQFRAMADFFRSVRYLHIVPQLVREPDRSVDKTNDPFGGDFLEQVGGKPTRTRDARLAKILTALRVAVPQLETLAWVRDDRGTAHLRGKYSHWRPQGAWQSEEEFSDGTLRLMGLLWAALDGSGPLLLEEPELSLHPDVVRRIPPMFARALSSNRRQIIISTHSPELLEDEGIGLDEVLLLQPDKEGTTVALAGSSDEICALLQERGEGGLTLGEAVMPTTRPKDVHQLTLWPE